MTRDEERALDAAPRGRCFRCGAPVIFVRPHGEPHVKTYDAIPVSGLHVGMDTVTDGGVLKLRTVPARAVLLRVHECDIGGNDPASTTGATPCDH